MSFANATRRSRTRSSLPKASNNLIMSSAHKSEHEGARLPKMPCPLSNRISAFVALSDFKFMFKIACRMLARIACSEGPRPRPLPLSRVRSTFVSNSRTAKKGPCFEFSRRKQTTLSSGFKEKLDIDILNN